MVSQCCECVVSYILYTCCWYDAVCRGRLSYVYRLMNDVSHLQGERYRLNQVCQLVIH